MGDDGTWPIATNSCSFKNRQLGLAKIVLAPRISLLFFGFPIFHSHHAVGYHLALSSSTPSQFLFVPCASLLARTVAS